MAVLRQQNWLNGQRVDIPHLRSLEIATAGDFDLLAGKIMTGARPLVISGLTIPLSSTTFGTSANLLTLNVGASIILHGTASEPGTIFYVPSGTSPVPLSGLSWTIGATNYVGIDLTRQADSTTVDLVKFRSATSLTEFSESVPLARTLNYSIIVNPVSFESTPNVLPIASVVLDANGNVTSITDCRQMAFRLGSGGTLPNPVNSFNWSSRIEQPVTSTNYISNSNPFSGADKSIFSYFDFSQALMSRLWEVGGGEHWYSQTSDRELVLVRNPSLVFASNENFQWDGTNLLWQGLKFYYAHSTGASNIIQDQTVNNTSSVQPNGETGLTNLAVGDCIYVDLNRAVNGATVIAYRSNLQTLGTPAIPGSRQVLAWRTAEGVFARGQWLPVGYGFAHASTTSFGTVELYSTYVPNPTNPVVPVVNASGQVVATGLTGAAPGTLYVGNEANDTAVVIGATGINTSVNGSLSVAQSLSVIGAAGFQNTVSVLPTGANLTAVTATGTGTGNGVNAQGAVGLYSVGTTSYGVEGVSNADHGVFGTSSIVSGVYGVCTAANGNGVEGHASGTGAGGKFTSSNVSVPVALLADGVSNSGAAIAITNTQCGLYVYNGPTPTAQTAMISLVQSLTAVNTGISISSISGSGILATDTNVSSTAYAIKAISSAASGTGGAVVAINLSSGPAINASSSSGIGINVFQPSTGLNAIVATTGSVTSGNGSTAGVFMGGGNSGSGTTAGGLSGTGGVSSSTSVGGAGVVAVGGASSTTSAGGVGLAGTGGNSTSGAGGVGVQATGGSGIAGSATSYGLVAAGSEASPCIYTDTTNTTGPDILLKGLATPPLSVAGSVYYDSSSKSLGFHNGYSWAYQSELILPLSFPANVTLNTVTASIFPSFPVAATSIVDGIYRLEFDLLTDYPSAGNLQLTISSTMSGSMVEHTTTMASGFTSVSNASGPLPFTFTVYAGAQTGAVSKITAIVTFPNTVATGTITVSASTSTATATLYTSQSSMTYRRLS